MKERKQILNVIVSRIKSFQNQDTLTRNKFRHAHQCATQ